MKTLLWISLIVMLVVITNTVLEADKADKGRALVSKAIEIDNGSAACNLFKTEFSDSMNSTALPPIGGWSTKTVDLARMVIRVCSK